ncbi:hypothetical protein FA13DRAFT_1739659, partial [Coprinellus micaceus]
AITDFIFTHEKFSLVLKGTIERPQIISLINWERAVPVDSAEWYQREGCQNSDENFFAAGDPAFSRPRSARAC